MAVMTISNIDGAIKTRLRVRAAQHRRSLEEEARDILHAALSLEGGGRSRRSQSRAVCRLGRGRA